MSQPAAGSARSSRPESILARLHIPLTIFIAAFLLFALEPMIAKMILPWFGGSTEVWIVCLLFFQAALLAGYVYAHVLSTRLDSRWQARVHLVLLAASLFFLPVIPAERWKPVGTEEPMLLILGVLASTIGLPFLLLAATSPLVQAWLSHSRPEAAGNPHKIYRLYALSNVGSLLALLLYPMLFEPWLPTRIQAESWSAVYCVFALLSAAAVWKHRNAAEDIPAAPVREPRPSIRVRTVWFLLALAPSALLLATTNYMLRNIAAIPLFWVVPLALYLLSFIVAFDNPRWYYRPLWYALFAASAGIMIYYAVGLFLIGNYLLPLAFYSGGLLISCMVCNGELAALKPAPSQLTSYYLIIATGGAAGGLLIAVFAPLVFSYDYDFAIVLPAVALLAILVAWRRMPAGLPAWLRWGALAGVLCGWGVVTGHAVLAARKDMSGDVVSARNFYGPLRVTMMPANQTTGEVAQLRNGNIIHGREFTAPARWCEPISYYSHPSGVGIAIKALQKDRPLNVGVIGLGAGAISAYGRQMDRFRFYEINPLVRAVATSTFHYLSCPGEHSFAIGDARLSLEREPSQHFDILVVDAFTSDAIPIHLLTREAFALYWRHLKPDGVLAVHVSNQYINLAPIVALAASQSGRKAVAIVNAEDPANAINGAVWVLVTARPDFFLQPELTSAKAVETAGTIAWTDDYSNLWRELK